MLGHGRGWDMRRKVENGRRGIKSRNGESTNLLGQHVTESLTKFCMVAYEW